MITNQDLLEYSILESVLSPLIKTKKVLNIKEMDEVFESLITEAKAKKLKTKILNKGYAKHVNTLTKKVTQDFVYDFYFLNHQPAFTSKKSATPEPINESATTEFPYSITFTYSNGGFICEEFGMIPEDAEESEIAQLYRAIDQADIFDSDWEMEEDEPYGIKISTREGDLTFKAEVEIQVDNTYTISRTIDDYLNERDGAATYDKGSIDCSNQEELIQELEKWKNAVNNAIGNINTGRNLEEINLNESWADDVNSEDKEYVIDDIGSYLKRDVEKKVNELNKKEPGKWFIDEYSLEEISSPVYEKDGDTAYRGTSIYKKFQSDDGQELEYRLDVGLFTGDESYYCIYITKQNADGDVTINLKTIEEGEIQNDWGSEDNSDDSGKHIDLVCDIDYSTALNKFINNANTEIDNFLSTGTVKDVNTEKTGSTSDLDNEEFI